MAEKSYLIEIDPSRNYLKATFSGLMTENNLEAMQADLAASFARLAGPESPPGSHLVLLDVREQGVLPQEVAARFQNDISHFGRMAGRTALLVSASALHKMQAKRIATLDSFRVVMSEDEAKAWLFDESPARD